MLINKDEIVVMAAPALVSLIREAVREEVENLKTVLTDRLITKKEACGQLGLHFTTFKKYMDEGVLDLTEIRRDINSQPRNLLSEVLRAKTEIGGRKYQRPKRITA